MESKQYIYNPPPIQNDRVSTGRMVGRHVVSGLRYCAFAGGLCVYLCGVAGAARLTPPPHVMPTAQLFRKSWPRALYTSAVNEMTKALLVHIHGLCALCARFERRKSLFAIVMSAHLSAIGGPFASVDDAVHVGGAVVVLAQG